MKQPSIFTALMLLAQCQLIASRALKPRAIALVTEWETVVVTEFIWYTIYVYPGGLSTSSVSAATQSITTANLASSLSTSRASKATLSPSKAMGALIPPSKAMGTLIPPSKAMGTLIPPSKAMGTLIPPSKDMGSLITPSSTRSPPVPSIPTPSPSAIVSTTTLIDSTTSSVPSPSSTASPSSGFVYGGVSQGVVYQGDMTWYGVGLGSCGITSTPDQAVVAIPHGQMSNGANPNLNPLCGHTVSISWGGKTTTATIVDTCMGCADGALDMSVSLFSYFADLGLGRGFAMKWELID